MEKKKKHNDLKYKGKCIKMSEETWEILKDKRNQSGMTWNRFLLELIKNK